MTTPDLSISQINSLPEVQLAPAITANEVEAFAVAYGKAAARHADAVAMYDRAIDEVSYKDLQLYWRNVEAAAADMVQAWLNWENAKAGFLAVQS